MFLLSRTGKREKRVAGVVIALMVNPSRGGGGGQEGLALSDECGKSGDQCRRTELAGRKLFLGTSVLF